MTVLQLARPHPVKLCNCPTCGCLDAIECEEEGHECCGKTPA